MKKAIVILSVVVFLTITFTQVSLAKRELNLVSASKEKARIQKLIHEKYAILWCLVMSDDTQGFASREKKLETISEGFITEITIIAKFKKDNMEYTVISKGIKSEKDSSFFCNRWISFTEIRHTGWLIGFGPWSWSSDPKIIPLQLIRNDELSPIFPSDEKYLDDALAALYNPRCCTGK